MDPDETQMFIDAFWWRLTLEDKQRAHYAAQHLSAATGKKIKPKKLRFLSDGPDEESDNESVEDVEPSTSPQNKAPVESTGKKQRAEDEKAALRRLKEFSKQRANEQRANEQ